MLAYYKADQVSITGEAKAYRREFAAGNEAKTFFCLVCGSTVYLKLAKQSGLVGVALGSPIRPSQRQKGPCGSRPNIIGSITG